MWQYGTAGTTHFHIAFWDEALLPAGIPCLPPSITDVLSQRLMINKIAQLQISVAKKSKYNQTLTHLIFAVNVKLCDKILSTVCLASTSHRYCQYTMHAHFLSTKYGC